MPILLGAAVGAAYGNPQGSPATPNSNCTLIVPDEPLTAAGLATPYELVATDPDSGPCHEANPNQSAFVQGTIIDPATGAVSVYDPLVIDAGTTPAVAPVVPALPAGAVVGLWFGFNGDTLTLSSASGRPPQADHCVNGLSGSPFGQFAYCDALQFFRAADAAIAQHRLVIPPLGTGRDGEPCPTVRDYAVVDQDQSDNVTTEYLMLPDGRTAQDTAAASARLAAGDPQILANGSDNLLLTAFIDPALGCKPFTAPDLADGGRPASSLALDELVAAADQRSPIALVPLSDPMTLNDGGPSTTKTDLYRAGVDQPEVDPATQTPETYCADMMTAAVRRLPLDSVLTTVAPSPEPTAATNLYTFLGSRLQASFTNLDCGRLLGEQNPVVVTTNGTGIAISISFGGPATTATTATTATSAAPSTTPAGTTPAGTHSTGPTTSPATSSATQPTTPATRPATTSTATTTAPGPTTPTAPHTPGAKTPTATAPATTTAATTMAATTAPPATATAPISAAISAAITAATPPSTTTAYANPPATAPTPAATTASGATGVVAAGGPTDTGGGTNGAGAVLPGGAATPSPSMFPLHVWGFEHVKPASAGGGSGVQMADPPTQIAAVSNSGTLWGMLGGAFVGLLVCALLLWRPWQPRPLR